MARSNYLTTYYAKRIIGDAAAADASSALLQTGTGITADTWIISRTNRVTDYGIKYTYDATNGDKIEFHGGSPSTVKAWVMLDNGDVYILGHVGIGGNPESNYSLYTVGAVWFNIGSSDNTTDKQFLIGHSGQRYLSLGGGGIQAYDASNNVTTLYLNYSGGLTQFGGVSSSGNVYIYDKLGVGYNPNTSGNTYKLYVDGTSNFTNYINLAGQSYDSALINFTRASINYINVPTGGTLGITVGGGVSANIRLQVENAAVHSYTTESVSLGTSSIRWNGVYSTTGNFSDNVTIASGKRIGCSGGSLYIGNSGNESWVYVQDMASQASGTPWKIHQNGNAEFTGTVSAGVLSAGSRETTSGPSSITYSNRITIVPYFHTGGPWYIKSGDDSSNAYLALYYNTTQLMRIKHDGTQMVDWKGNANTASKWYTARTLTIGATGKSVDGSSNVSWSMNEIMGSSTSAYFYRGDKTWSNDLVGRLTVDGLSTSADIIFDATGTTGTSAKITWSGSTDAADIYYYVPSSDQGNLVINTRDDTNCLVAFAYNGTIKAYMNNSTPCFYPATDGTGTIGTTTREWDSTYTRVIYARHFDASYPYTGDRNMYYGYNKADNHYFYTMDGTTRTHRATINATGLYINQPAGNRNAGIIGQYDSTKAALIWSMGSSYNIKADGTTLGSLYGAAYAHTNATGALGSRTLAGGHQFLWCQKGGVNVALGNNIWTNGSLYIKGADHGIYFEGTKNTYRMIRFIDNTGDVYGNGISIGGGGYTVIGAGESADTMVANRGYTGGSEVMIVASDGEIQFFPGNDSYDASAQLTMTSSRFWAGVNGNTAREAQVGCQSGAGQLYLWSAAATNGDRGLYLPAHGTGESFAILRANTNNSITILGNDVWGSNVRLVDNWAGFYNARQGGTRYGYIQCNVDRMYFRKENSTANLSYYFDFNANVYTSGHFYGTSSSSSWIDGQRYMNAGFCLTDATNTGSYWPWLRQTNTSSKKWFSVGTLNTSLYVIGSATTKTDNSYDYGWRFDLSNGYLYGNFSGSLSGNASTATKLATARAINGTNFDGSGAITTANWGTSRTLTVGGTGKSVNGSGNVSWSKAEILGSSTNAYFYRGDQTWSNTINGTFTATTVKGAVWNDYAECRMTETEEPGRCVTETHSGRMRKTFERLMPGCKIISDTYGTLIGETDTAKTPIAVAGRVLVYPYRSRTEYNLGDAVCSAPNGTVDVMTRDEIMMYPERIVGTVSEIPNYGIWYGGSKESPTPIEVKGRIWIYVR